MLIYCSVDVCVHCSSSFQDENGISSIISPFTQHELYFFSGAVLSVVAGVVTDTGGGVSVLNECEVEFLSRGADGRLLA